MGASAAGGTRRTIAGLVPARRRLSPPRTRISPPRTRVQFSGAGNAPVPTSGHELGRPAPPLAGEGGARGGAARRPRSRLHRLPRAAGRQRGRGLATRMEVAHPRASGFVFFGGCCVFRAGTPGQVWGGVTQGDAAVEVARQGRGSCSGSPQPGTSASFCQGPRPSQYLSILCRFRPYCPLA